MGVFVVVVVRAGQVPRRPPWTGVAGGGRRRELKVEPGETPDYPDATRREVAGGTGGLDRRRAERDRRPPSPTHFGHDAGAEAGRVGRVGALARAGGTAEPHPSSPFPSRTPRGVGRREEGRNRESRRVGRAGPWVKGRAR